MKSSSWLSGCFRLKIDSVVLEVKDVGLVDKPVFRWSLFYHL